MICEIGFFNNYNGRTKIKELRTTFRLKIEIECRDRYDLVINFIILKSFNT